MNFFNPLFIFALLGVLWGALYALKWGEIFVYAWDKNREDYQREKENIQWAKNHAKGWYFEHSLHHFMGAFIGWMTFWFLLEHRINFFDNINNSIGSIDIALFLLAFTGIIGRLPDLVASFITGIRNTTDTFKQLVSK